MDVKKRLKEKYKLERKNNKPSKSFFSHYGVVSVERNGVQDNLVNYKPVQGTCASCNAFCNETWKIDIVTDSNGPSWKNVLICDGTTCFPTLYKKCSYKTQSLNGDKSLLDYKELLSSMTVAEKRSASLQKRRE